jgi:hypothetical protein
MVGVGNAFRCTMPITISWITVNFHDLATFNTIVHPAGWSIEDIAGGNGDNADDSNVAKPSYRKFDQDSLNISSAPKMYHMAVICMIGAGDSF